MRFFIKVVNVLIILSIKSVKSRYYLMIAFPSEFKFMLKEYK